MNDRRVLETGNRTLFMPYVCCGDPSEEFTLKLIRTLVENGADAIELGIPFSDPIADGKTIQAASNRALINGMTPKKAIEMVRQLRSDGIRIPIFIMTYYNIVYANGIEKFVEEIKKAGANGLIIPDLPIDESEEVEGVCKKQKMALTRFITPNTPNERMKRIVEKASQIAGSFIYAVSVLGTTGARRNVVPEAIELIGRIKKMTKVPVVAGFGISIPEQAKEFADAGADGVIIGSVIVELYSEGIGKDGGEEKALEKVAKFTREMNKALTARGDENVTNLYKPVKS